MIIRIRKSPERESQRKLRDRQKITTAALYGDYRDVIKAEFLRRKEKSVKYTQQEFAQQIGISPSHLSRVMNKKRGLSPKTVYQAGLAIGLSGHVFIRFESEAQVLSARALWKRNVARQILAKPLMRNARMQLDILRGRVMMWEESPMSGTHMRI